MDTIRIILINTEESVQQRFQHQLAETDVVKIIVEHIEAKEAERKISTHSGVIDVVIFGEHTAQSTVIRLTRLFRNQGISAPILILTRESEARLPAKLLHVGVTDMLNIAEVNTPVFLWTFMSILKQAEVKKKAEEFDELRHRLHQVNESLAFITHEINNPLSVIRLALYNLKKETLPHDKKELFFSLLIENVGKVDDQIKRLYEIRTQLGEDTSILSKILSEKKEEQAVVY